MKKSFKIACITLLIACFQLKPQGQAQAQMAIVEAVRYAAKKVIRAVDLQIQRLQNRTIDLQNIQRQIENTLSKLKLDEISDWTNRQKEIYQQYFDELWRVKSLISYYKRIRDIIEKQKQLVSEYKRAFKLFDEQGHFAPDELDYIRSVYNGIIDKSLQSLDQILLLLESFTVQMSDAERLQLLNRSADEIQEYITDLRSFTNRNIRLSLQRARDLKDIETLKRLYGLEN